MTFASSAEPARKRGHCLLLVASSVLLLILSLAGATPAEALKAIQVTGEQERIEITNLGELFEGRGDQLQIETAVGPDGATGRMAVRATTSGTSPAWLAFALHNPTEKTVELWLTAERYSAIGSGIVWPDLDARRIETVSHSAGFLPERIKSDRTDIFRLTIERGQTITYVAELASDRFARIYLWKPIEFEQRSRDRQLFNGIMLGITGILAVFLTAVFAANHKSIFPTAALVAWCVLALLCVDFGFWHKLFQMRPEDNAQYRAAAEAALAASLLIFLFAFLRGNLWHGFARTLFFVWVVGQLALLAIAVLDPRLAATIARMSFAVIGLVGGLIILFLSMRGLGRALAMVPTWILFLVWLFGAGVTLTGRLSGEFAIFGLVAGLVLIMLLIGFTVTQYAFRSTDPIYGSNPSQQQLRLAAIERAGVSVWEWAARRDELRFDQEIELSLGHNQGELPTRVPDLVTHLHPADKERFLISLASIKERLGGALQLEIRMRHVDSSYRWFELDGASVPTSDARQLRCVGLIRDITDEKRAQERLMHDAVHDSLTGLPNRQLLLDRLDSALRRARAEQGPRPAVLYIDIDKFKSVNSSFGMIVGDSMLLTVARRLQRHVGPEDTLARMGGDQFAVVVTSQQEARELAHIAERLRLALRSPVRMAGQEIVLTGAIGIALFDGSQVNGRDLLREAEVAMVRAKRAGSDRIEGFRPELRADKDERIAIESDLRRAIESRQLKLRYQPIISLSNEELVGFEALVRWQHPKHGLLSPSDFVPVAEESDLIVQLGSYVLNQAVQDIAHFQKELPRPEPLFVSINVSSRQLIKPDLVQEIRHAVGRAVVPSDSLRLEITESLVMENPEQSAHILELLREVGVHLALDDFGTGYSSLAYLNRFPFDTIKIDKAIVQASSERESNAIIVRSIVALAGELNKKIVAEGVETIEDAAFLRSIGCHFAQGFHYGEPMTDADVMRLLKLIRKADRRMRRRGLVRGLGKKKAANGHADAPPIAPALQSAPPSQQPQPNGSAPPHPVRPPATNPSLHPVMPVNGAAPRPPVSQPNPQPQRTANGAASRPPAAIMPPGAPASSPRTQPPAGPPRSTNGHAAPPTPRTLPPTRPPLPHQQPPVQSGLTPGGPPPAVSRTAPPSAATPQQAKSDERPGMLSPLKMPAILGRLMTRPSAQTSAPSADQTPRTQPPALPRDRVSEAQKRPVDYSSLPPAMAERLQRLAGQGAAAAQRTRRASADKPASGDPAKKPPEKPAAE